MSIKYARIIHAIQSTPWAIQPQRLVDIMEVMAAQAAGGKLSADEVAQYLDVEAASRPRTETRGAIAVIGLRGIIEHRIEQVQDISGPGGTSIEGFRNRFRDAMNNDAVGAVVLDIDSPGGSVDGIAEMAAEMHDARGAKPIVAVANTLAASAAYWLGSQADELVVTPSGEVGSIGVFTAHRDLSKRLEMEGEKVTLIHAGAHKVEGNPFEPLSPEAADFIQTVVNGYYAEFVDAVARGRGVKAAKVEADYGQGRVYRAKDAVARGMADSVETLDQVIARLRGSAKPARRANVPRGAGAFEFWTPSAAK